MQERDRKQLDTVHYSKLDNSRLAGGAPNTTDRTVRTNSLLCLRKKKWNYTKEAKDRTYKNQRVSGAKSMLERATNEPQQPYFSRYFSVLCNHAALILE